LFVVLQRSAARSPSFEDQDVIHLGAKGIVVVGPHEGPAGFFIAAMAMISLLCAVYEAMNQRIWSSGALATIFVVAFLLFYFPQLASRSLSK
jgi:hypothetical protein